MSSHEAKKQAAKAALEELFGDTSVSAQTTYESLDEILSDLQIRLEGLAEDLKRTEE